MTIVFDIPANTLINKVAEELHGVSNIKAPEWAEFVKTGVHKQMSPENPDWWYIRAAAVLRRIYVDGPLGVERMRTIYGGMQDNGSKPSHFRKGSGSIARKVMQQLEAAGFVEKVPAGRAISAKGRKFLDGVAHSLKEEVIKTAPGLEKY
ncbi:MAG TPA: 30S ribosomal protein S19e [Methanocorpusculum sp.]|nr:30S ribosomal protein S19e [Methanocorpusculum sp.]